jgi:hypothetical protein
MLQKDVLKELNSQNWRRSCVEFLLEENEYVKTSGGVLFKSILKLLFCFQLLVQLLKSNQKKWVCFTE